MESILNWGIGVIEAVQSIKSGPMTFIMSVFSVIGDKYVYFALLPFLFWCVDERKAVRLGFVSFASAFLNSYLKDLLAVPRPYAVKPGINQGYAPLAKAFPGSLSPERLPPGSLPSGHAQSSLALWGMLATWFRKPWGLGLAIIVPFLVGLSRVYLGVHYPTDVLAGWGLSGVVLLVYYLFGEKAENFLGKVNLRIQVALAALVAWIFCALNLKDVSAAAGLFGMAIGYAFMRTKVRFDASSGKKWKKALRYFLGMAIVVGLYVGLKAAFPGEGSSNYALFSFLRYALVSAFVSLGAPALFVRLKLADARPREGAVTPSPANSADRPGA